MTVSSVMVTFMNNLSILSFTMRTARNCQSQTTKPNFSFGNMKKAYSISFRVKTN